MCEWRYQRSGFWLRFKFRVGSKEKRAKVEGSSHPFIHLITFYPVLGTLVVQRSNPLSQGAQGGLPGGGGSCVG